MAFVFLAVFCRILLKTKAESPNSDKVLLFLFWFYLIGSLSFFFIDDISIISAVNSPAVLFTAMSLLILMIVRFFQGSKEAAYTMVGMGCFYVGMLGVAGGALNLHDHYAMAPMILKLGSSIEMILFSIALAHKINDLELRNKTSLEQVSRAREEAEINAKYSAKLDQVNKQLELLVDAKTEFLSNVSIQIKKPLYRLQDMIDLSKTSDVQGDRNTFLEAANRSGMELQSLLDDILNLSKIDAGELKLETSDVNLYEIVQELREHHLLQLQDSGLYFMIACDSQFPKTIKGDRNHWRQILNNLITNALKFTSQGGLKVVMRTESDNTLYLAVEDTGVGIKPEDKSNVFDSLSHAVAKSDHQVGTGLGLILTKKLVELMDGNIRVESKEGQGSQFILEVPFKVDEKNRKAANVQSTGISTQIKAFNGLKALVAEDNAANQVLINGLLSSLKMDVDIVSDGIPALEKAKENTYDVIFLDIQMLEMGGVETAKKIRKESPLNKSTPIIAMASNGLEYSDRQCERAGMIGHIVKPLDSRSLADAITKWK